MSRNALASRGGWRFRGLAVAAACAAVLLATDVVLVGATHDLYRRVSAGQVNGNGPYDAYWAAFSADGTRVFFITDESLVAADTDGWRDVYQRFAGTTTLVSAGQINGNGGYYSDLVATSADGTRAFFTTNEQLVSGDTDSTTDIYQRFNGTTTRISVGAINGNGAFDAYFRRASADGSRIWFLSPERLVSADTDNAWDLYERSAGATTLISAGAINGNGAFDVEFGGASTDGSRVFFTTDEQLVSADQDARGDVYQRAGGVTTRISVGAINGNGNIPASFAGASADGTRVFFRTSEQLVSGDTDGFYYDIYQRFNGATTRMSVGSINGNGPFDAYLVGTSADGTRAFFATEERLLTNDTDNAQDIYQRYGTKTLRISVGAINGNTNGFDAFAYFASVSGNGARVYFRTRERLASSDTDAWEDVYVRSNGVTTHLTRGQINGNGAFYAFFGAVSADGSRFFFSTEEQLVPDDQDSFTDAYERSGGVTTLISDGDGSGYMGLGGVTSDGTRAILNGNERLTANDKDAAVDVYVVIDIP